MYDLDGTHTLYLSCRFGHIMSVVAKRDIVEGEEILVSYNYEMVHAPEWYKDLWFTHLIKNLGWSEEEIEGWCRKETAKWGYRLECKAFKKEIVDS